MTGPRRWKAGIIAAGAGERLRTGDGILKPLVTIDGEALVDHVLASIGEIDPTEVVVIVNERSTEGTAARSVEMSVLNVPGVLTITYSHMKGVCTKGV